MNFLSKSGYASFNSFLQTAAIGLQQANELPSKLTRKIPQLEMLTCFLRFGPMWELTNQSIVPVRTTCFKSGPHDVMLTEHKHAQSPTGQCRVVDVSRIR